MIDSPAITGESRILAENIPGMFSAFFVGMLEDVLSGQSIAYLYARQRIFSKKH
jgi:hypothetical protein